MDRIPDDVLVAFADEVIGPELPDSPSFRAYRIARFDLHTLLDWSHPKQVRATEYQRRRVAAGRAFGGVRR
jgi:hypothetical protein